MTRPSLAGIEQRAAEATEWPWRTDVETRGDAVVWGPDGAFISNAQGEPHWLPAPDGSERQAQFDVDRRDAAFIADARTAVPALTAVVRDVLALHTEDRGFCQNCDHTHPCPTVHVLAAHLDLTDPEGEPT